MSVHQHTSGNCYGCHDEWTDGRALVEAEKHQPDRERGGCICGFCAWSVDHVVVMVNRARRGDR